MNGFRINFVVSIAFNALKPVFIQGFNSNMHSRNKKKWVRLFPSYYLQIVFRILVYFNNKFRNIMMSKTQIDTSKKFEIKQKNKINGSTLKLKLEYEKSLLENRHLKLDDQIVHN